MGMVAFQDRIKQYLETYEKTQQEVADKLGYSRQAVSSWLTGRTTPALGDVPEIAKKLGVSLSWLLGHPNTSMTNNEELDKVSEMKIEDEVTRQEAPTLNLKGSMLPVYTREQLDRRMEMISRALDLFDRGKISEESLRLIVNSLK